MSQEGNKKAGTKAIWQDSFVTTLSFHGCVVCMDGWCMVTENFLCRHQSLFHSVPWPQAMPPTIALLLAKNSCNSGNTRLYS